jgi:alpha-tubulin suppressor-like RCC1 family protein
MRRIAFVAAVTAASISVAPGTGAAAGSGTLDRGARELGQKAISISAGKRHACVVTSAGDVACWGANSSGQLGDGTSADSSIPVAAEALGAAAVAVSVGGDHTCALTNRGAVECWGWNRFGQLGDGTKAERHVPAAVKGLAGGVVEITAGGSHACARTTRAAVECWGANRYGQLGDGTETHRLTPVRVRGLAGRVVALSAGGRHTCALIATGTVQCWGANYWGQLGDGTYEGRLQAGAVRGLSGKAVAISAGRYFTCAVLRSGRVECWGANFLGQLGNDRRAHSSVPMVVDVEGPVEAVTAGGRHTCALT